MQQSGNSADHGPVDHETLCREMARLLDECQRVHNESDALLGELDEMFTKKFGRSAFWINEYFDSNQMHDINYVASRLQSSSRNERMSVLIGLAGLPRGCRLFVALLITFIQDGCNDEERLLAFTTLGHVAFNTSDRSVLRFISDYRLAKTPCAELAKWIDNAESSVLGRSSALDQFMKDSENEFRQ